MKKKNILLICIATVLILIIGLYLFFNSTNYKLRKLGYSDDIINIIVSKKLVNYALIYENPKLFSFIIKNEKFNVKNIKTYELLSNYKDKFDIINFTNLIIKEKNYNENLIKDYASKYSGNSDQIGETVKVVNGINEKNKLVDYLLNHYYKKDELNSDSQCTVLFYKNEGDFGLDINIHACDSTLYTTDQTNLEGNSFYLYYYFIDDDIITGIIGDDEYRIIYSKNYITLDTSCTSDPLFLRCDGMETSAASFRSRWFSTFKKANVNPSIWFYNAPSSHFDKLQ